MANKKLRLGILVIFLAFGMPVVGWADNEGAANLLDYYYNFSTSKPSTEALDAGNLTQAEFSQIRDAGGGGFQGWAIDDGDLLMAWTGRVLLNFTRVARILDRIFGEANVYIEEGVHYADGGSYILEFFPLLYEVDYLYIPAGTLILVF